MESLERRISELFHETERIMENPNNTQGFKEVTEALWTKYIHVNLQIFGNHQIYNIAMNAYEKAHKRHFPRKSELKFQEEIFTQQSI